MLDIGREKQKNYFDRSESRDLWDMLNYILILINLYYNMAKIFKYSNIQIFLFYLKQL